MGGAHRGDGGPGASAERRGAGWATSGAEPGWIDAHVHVFPPEMIARREAYLPRDDRFAALYSSPRARMATADEVVAQMDETGVAQSIVFGFPFEDQGLCRMVNDYVLGGGGCVAGPARRSRLRIAREAGSVR